MPLFNCLLAIILDKMAAHNYFDADRIADLYSHAFATMYEGETDHSEVLQKLEQTILDATDIQQLPFLVNLMRRLANAQDGGEFFLAQMTPEDLFKAIEVNEKPDLEAVKRAGVAAASLGTYARITKDVEPKLAAQTDSILALIEAFPSDYVNDSEEQLHYITWYGFAMQAAGEMIRQAKDASEIV